MLFNLFGAKNKKPEIIDYEKQKEFRYGSIVYSRIYKEGLYTGSYWDFFLPLPSLYENPSVLIIGLGGGTIPFQMQEIYKNKAKISVVEIDKYTIELARKFLPSIKFDIINADGIKFVHESHNKFDVIVLDAYIKDTIPKEFLDESFIQDSHSALKEEGILAVNYALGIRDLIRLNNYISKLRKYFGVYKLVSTHLIGNNIIVCSKKLDKERIVKGITDSFPVDKNNRFILDAYREMIPY